MVAQTAMGAISPSTGRTLPDRYIEGTCPICSYDGARGDQCDNCGNQLDAIELGNPRSRINGETPVFVETEHFFLDLPALAETLGSWLATRTDWRPNVLKFAANLLDDVRPRAMTRDIDWGIPVPLPGWQEDPAKRLYVWFDAVVGYLSASIEWARRTGDPQAWRAWWTDPDARSYYFMGKDNITFHAQIWPAELLGYAGHGAKGGRPGVYGELNLPTEVVSSEFLTMEGKQFSSSRGVVIYVRDMLERYQPDALRYYIAAAGPETADADFTWAEFVRRTNTELVAGWGNLVNRTATLVHKNIGEIPAADTLTDADRDLLAGSAAAFAAVGDLLATHRQKQAVSEAMRAVGQVNAYISDQAPFKLTVSDPERMRTILHVATQAVSDCRTLLSPFLPHSTAQVEEVFGGFGTAVPGAQSPMPQIREVDDLDGGPGYPVLMGDYASSRGVWRSIPVVVGTPVTKPSPIFTKLDDSVIDAELDRMRDEPL